MTPNRDEGGGNRVRVRGSPFLGSFFGGPCHGKEKSLFAGHGARGSEKNLAKIKKKEKGA